MTVEDILKIAVTALVAAVGWLVTYSLKTRERVSELETKIAEDYATNEYVREVEGRLGTALDKIDGKLDRLINKLLDKD